MVLYPEVQARAQAEIDSVIGEDLERLPDWDDRASMPYVDAVIQETLRWFPVVPLGQYYRILVEPSLAVINHGFRHSPCYGK
jgi:cytochrome P450